jgi:ABC-type multidrug transport system fused ATPase/permease subunit
MVQPLAYYQQEKSKYKIQLEQLRVKSGRLSLMRMGLFVCTGLLAYFAVDHTLWLVILLFTGLVVFILLVLYHEQLRYKRDLVTHLLKINIIEIEALSGNYSDLNTGSEFIDPKHFYSNDIDLFGKGSFFQYLNRTCTDSGKKELAEILTSNDISGIDKKQLALQELAKEPGKRQLFMALARMVSTAVDNQVIVSWIKNYKGILPGSMKYLPTVFAALSVLLIGLSIFGVLPFSVLLLWFTIGLVITAIRFKHVNQLYQDAGNAKNTFKQCHKLLKEIENYDFRSDLLVQQQSKIKTADKNASLIFMKFSKIMDAFDQRNNMIFGALGNGFLLWDLHQGFRIEKWIAQYRDQVENWFEIIAFFDARFSLANYVFNHPRHCFPSLNIDENVMEASAMGHPLIPADKRICNDFYIKDQDFIIITGANMAGKSTFLRTVSLSVVMANEGLPVCAETFHYTPVKLITSMRTSDSLADESSYFYAEIMRLRFIVEQMKKEKYFIVLDEILKGTNSKDKAMGSKKFVERLVESGSTGIIATHDLSLCDIETKYPQIKNKYFDVEIKNDALYFDYLLKDGVCVNMNASFLLKKMEII